MNYRVAVNLAFPEKEDADDMMQEARRLFPRAVNINEGQPNEEIGY